MFLNSENSETNELAQQVVRVARTVTKVLICASDVTDFPIGVMGTGGDFDTKDPVECKSQYHVICSQGLLSKVQRPKANRFLNQGW